MKIQSKKCKAGGWLLSGQICLRISRYFLNYSSSFSRSHRITHCTGPLQGISWLNSFRVLTTMDFLTLPSYAKRKISNTQSMKPKLNSILKLATGGWRSTGPSPCCRKFFQISCLLNFKRFRSTPLDRHLKVISYPLLMEIREMRWLDCLFPSSIDVLGSKWENCLLRGWMWSFPPNPFILSKVIDNKNFNKRLVAIQSLPESSNS